MGSGTESTASQSARPSVLFHTLVREPRSENWPLRFGLTFRLNLQSRPLIALPLIPSIKHGCLLRRRILMPLRAIACCKWYCQQICLAEISLACAFPAVSRMNHIPHLNHTYCHNFWIVESVTMEMQSLSLTSTLMSKAHAT